MTGRDLGTAALEELGIIAAGSQPTAEDADVVNRRLARLLDAWNGKDWAVYADVIATYTLTGSLQPHTFGPTGATFTVTQRPEDITDANIVLSGSRYPVSLHDAAWWMRVGTPAVTGRPTDGYYESSWPNGSLTLWPVPDAAYSLEMRSRVLLSAYGLNTTFTLPPGYQRAIELSLAEEIAPVFEREVTPALKSAAREARADVFAKNDITPRIDTRDGGMPGGRSTFDWRTGRCS
jgi:hypothetical protein